MSDIVIKVENLSKLHRIGAKQERYKTLRDILVSTFKNSIKSFVPDKPDRPEKLKKPDIRDRRNRPEYEMSKLKT